MTSPKMKKEINRQLFSYWKGFYRDVLGLKDWEQRCRKRLNDQDIPRKELLSWSRIRPHLEGSRVLDVGCGTGGFCMAAFAEGADVLGIDIDPKAIDICRMQASANDMPPENFAVSASEELPFENDYFDFVYCNSVLEHVHDVEMTVSEMLRVVRPDGLLFIKFPDYRSFYEGHYKVGWLPKLPRLLGRIYLKSIGRPTGYLGEINYIDLPGIKRNLGDKVEIKSESIVCGGRAIEKIHYRLMKIGRYAELIAVKRAGACVPVGGGR
jgi:2-polyprenyl-3-methyl-5-hydroxy-6-metoxy-1,4-benzoquinol methylase